MPGPWSRTVTSPSRTVTSIVPPGGLHLAALSSRLPTARSSCAPELRAPGSARRRARRSRPGACRRARSTDRRTRSSRRRSSRSSPFSAPRARLTTSPTRRLRSSSWAVTSPSSRRRSPGRAAWSWASTSMLVRSAVSGVRSSCEASITSRRWLSWESSSAESISLKVRASRADLVAALDVDAPAEVAGVGDLLGGAVAAAAPAPGPARATAAASRPASAMPTTPTSASAQRRRPRCR